MASIRYLNQSGPFWDFIANFENQFGQPGNEEGGPSGPHHPPPPHRGGRHGPPHRGNWHRGPMPHHPHHHPWGPPPPHHGGPPHHPDHRGPPPPGDHDGDHEGEHPPPDYEDSPDTLMGDEKADSAEKQAAETSKDKNKDKDAGDCSSGESGPEGPSHNHRRSGRCGRRGRCAGGRGRHSSGPEGHHHRGHSHGPDGHHRGHSHGRRGGPGGPGGPWGFGGGRRHGGNHHHASSGPGAWGGAGGMFPIPPFAGRWMDFLASEFAQAQGHGGRSGETGADALSNERSANADFPSFTPPADIFDTPAAYVLHVPLPGAKKDDVSVSWDAERSEVSISGVTYRAGDEAFLATLALDEREVGAFERTVRLGSRANPAAVDVEGISAKLEDGVLVVEVPKSEAFVEVRKVDVE